MTAANLETRPYARLDETCRIIAAEMRTRERLIYMATAPENWLPILSERLPQYSMQPHRLGVLITRNKA